MCAMTFEAYLRQQAEGGQYGVALIKSETALRIADWIESHRDAVPVVRCKDCQYAHMSTDGRVKYCDVWFPDEAEYLEGDDYCSYGERRSDDK